MTDLPLDTPARQRLVTDLLGWNVERPRVPAGLVARLRDELESGFASIDGLEAAAARQRRGSVPVTKTRLDHLACDGLALDAAPYRHTWAGSRGTLGHAAIERDWDEGRVRAAADVVRDVWHEQASRRPGDPASLSAWMNAQPATDVAAFQDDLADLLEGFREVWPPLPPERVVTRMEPDVAVDLAGGLVRLFGQPDLVLASPRRDGRARTLVVDLKTGRPNSEHDRHELRFYALLMTLHAGEPPFRWATYYVTEGRHESEDLREDVLLATVLRVVDSVRQQVRLTLREPAPGDADLTLRGGRWCAWCLREPGCDVAASARAQWLSQVDDTLRP